MKKLKIAIFSGAIPSSTFIEGLIEGVAKHHQVYLFGVAETPKTYTSKNITLYKTPYSHFLNLLFTIWRVLQLLLKRPNDVIALFQEVKNYSRFYDQWVWFSKFLPIVLYRPDIMHIQWARDIEFYMFLKTRFKIPMIISLRGAHINYTPIVEPRMANIYKACFPLVDEFHAVSEAIAIEAQKYNAEASKIKVIHSPLPKKTLDQFKFKRKNNQPLKILSVGRFHWKKGYKYAIDACNLLKKQEFDFNYTIVSSNTMSEEILFQTHQLELNKKITFLKGMTQLELFQFMNDFDVLILPSLEEGIANVVLEAMALGLPVISTDCGGMAEVVIPKETGWLVPIRNAQLLADTILEFSQTPENEINDMTQRAHDFVKYHFDSDQSIQQFLQLYEELMNRNN
ncbi:glycosyltransferase family 4 protein [Formosa maritima]|uniref:Glycosyltransferase family 4 protein n=1 Tax=Formosa maritima TaxID=2592046 RepID=A0A5D0GFS8_9FLAO|nr:glycosyltransferase family 4 protein [Formosa maritima]TYA56657.1 glycosyltransferase family 4 protein [Formosa maritima]